MAEDRLYGCWQAVGLLTGRMTAGRVYGLRQVVWLYTGCMAGGRFYGCRQVVWLLAGWIEGKYSTVLPGEEEKFIKHKYHQNWLNLSSLFA